MGAYDWGGTNDDAPITNPAIKASGISLLKGIVTQLAGGLAASLGQKAMAASVPVVIASDQSGLKSRFIAAVASAYTRPANATAYSANDAVSNNGAAASVTPITFTMSDTNDDPITLERVRIQSSDTGPATAVAQFRVWLFNSDPTASTGVQAGDNSAWSQKQAGYIGTMVGTFRAAFDGSVAVCVPDEGSRIITTPATGAKTVFALLQTLTAFTPSANSTTFTLTMEGLQGRA